MMDNVTHEIMAPKNVILNTVIAIRVSIISVKFSCEILTKLFAEVS